MTDSEVNNKSDSVCYIANKKQDDVGPLKKKKTINPVFLCLTLLVMKIMPIVLSLCLD